MDTLNIIFGIVSLVAFGFSIYSHFNNRSMKVVEATKTAIQKERLRNISASLMGIMYSVDSIVQIPKRSDVTTVEELQNIARNIRASLMGLAKQLELEQKRLDEWRYGKLFESDNVN